jgi:hypothetical protein
MKNAASRPGHETGSAGLVIAGLDPESILFFVMRGLDPRIHPLCKSFSKIDGYAGLPELAFLGSKRRNPRVCVRAAVIFFLICGLQSICSHQDCIQALRGINGNNPIDRIDICGLHTKLFCGRRQ